MRSHVKKSLARIRSFQFLIPQFLCGDFFNSIGQNRPWRHVRVVSPFYPQLQTLVGAAGTAASCQNRP